MIGSEVDRAVWALRPSESEISNLPEVKQYEANGVALTEVLGFINKYKYGK